MKKYKLADILIPLIVFGLVVVMTFFYIFPAITTLIDKNSKINSYDKNITIYTSNVNKLSTLNINSVNNSLVATDQQIPASASIANLVDNTIKLAESLGLIAQRDTTQNTSVTPTPGLNPNNNVQKQAVNIEELQSGDPENVPQSILINGIAYPINFTLTVKGDKNNILNFMDKLSHSQRIMNILSVNLVSNSTDKKQWTADLIIYPYALYKNVIDTRPIKKITDPLDSTLSNKAQEINLNF